MIQIHIEEALLRIRNARTEDVFELMEPTSPESPVARFMERRGEGVQYIGLEVTGLDEAVEELRGKGFRFTSERPVEYPDGSRWAFIHPKEMFGVLFALIENPISPDSLR